MVYEGEKHRADVPNMCPRSENAAINPSRQYYVSFGRWQCAYLGRFGWYRYQGHSAIAQQLLFGVGLKPFRI